jgi:ribose 1,5-bisphosphokinase
MNPSGCWVFIVGPSGAGKDSVLRWARHALAATDRADGVVFARRLETRAGVADDETRRTVSPQELVRLREGCALAFHWQAHGIDYAIEATHQRDVAAGRQVLVNGSRAHVAQLDRAQRPVRVVLVTASADLRAARLAARGREPTEDIESRLVRADALPPLHADCVIENEGELAHAGGALIAYLQRCR